MKESFFTRHRGTFLHVSFWAVYGVYRYFDLYDFDKDYTWMFVSVPVFFYSVASYLHYFFILPLWVQHKQISAYLFSLVVLITITVLGKLFIELKIFASLRPDIDYFNQLTHMHIIGAVWNTSSFLLFTGMLRFTLERFDLENKQKQLQNEKLIAELNYLKAQINPHFLFNTLHNLNYLVYSGSKNATEVIIKLSNIMRYMIYDAKKERVPLVRELDYIRDYIHLEGIRLNNSFNLINTEGEIGKAEIAPLVFITLVENAFKHGVKDVEQNCWVTIHVHVSNQTIVFQVANRKISNSNGNLPSGFGLENLRKRLALSYPNGHRLEIDENKTEYKTTLTIFLS